MTGSLASWMIVVTAVALGAQNRADVEPVCSVSIGVRDNTFRIGHPVPLEIVVRNITNAEHEVNEWAPVEWNFIIKIVDEHGRAPVSSDYKRQLDGEVRKPRLFAFTRPRLRAGEQLKYSVALSKLYKLEAGVYTVSVSYKDDSGSMIVSNTIRLTLESAP